jgi:hypothetical protein
MSNINLRNRKTICFVFGFIFIYAFAAQATVSLPAPDNAALLYYQAMLLRPELDDDTFISFDRVLSGDDPDEKIREYLNLPDSCEAIRLAEAASKILDCSWGLSRPQGYKTLLTQARQLTFFLEVDARTLAVDGQYRIALERCLSIRRFARHLYDEGFLGYAIAVPIDSRALRCIHYILGLMPRDRDILIWLQSQISNVQGAPPPPGRAYEIGLNDDIQWLSEDPDLIEKWREYISDNIEDESLRQEILTLNDEEVLERVKESYNKFLSSANRIVGSDMPYQQKHLELKKSEEELKSDPIVDPFYYLLISLPRNVAEQHDIYVQGITVFNATRVAIEIYLIKAETGQLPEELPSDLPKDPFTGQDFGYNVTDKGFIISFDPEDLGDLRIRQFEFAIAQ